MISARNLSKGFKLYRNPSLRLAEALLRRSYHTRYQALHDVSFELAAGEALGVIGRNGAGKSTLLKLLSGVLLPDSGSLQTAGRVTGLLELGTGFDATMSGAHNIRTNGLMLGMTDSEIEAKRESICEFAELGPFIDEPLRTYSSGMAMRLAFAIAIHADPDTFLIDEALSVGDGHFQQKCMRRIRAFQEGAGSILFVSHDLNAVKMLCDRVIVLERGRVVYEGAPPEAINHYNRILADGNAGDIVVTDDDPRGYGDHSAEIVDVSAVGADSATTTVSSGEELLIDVCVVARRAIDDVTAGFLIRDRFGQDIFGSNTNLMGHTKAMTEGEESRLSLRIPVHLHPGKYTLTLSLHEGRDHTKRCYHWWDNAVRFEVNGMQGAPFIGVCDLRATLEGWS